MKEINFEVTYKYKIEIDETNEIVKEYESETDLLCHLANYGFSKELPVMEAVRLISSEIIEMT